MHISFRQKDRFLFPLCLFLLLAAMCSCNPEREQKHKPAQKSEPFRPISILSESTLFTVYGRAFDRAPILGRLGTYSSFRDMEKDIAPWIKEIEKRHSKKRIIPAIHLIYAMAIPCTPKDDCLLYLEGTVKDIVGTYIEPAAKRGWMVILDTQLGKSTPVEQVKRILDKGYLNYDNVAVALDPEFHVYPGRKTPGTPIGVVSAAQINKAQKMLQEHSKAQKLPTKKILIVHQFGDANVPDGVPVMVTDKKNLRTFDNVELVLDADGLGNQDIKVIKYNKITDSKIYPFIKFRGIKVFFPNRWEKHGHFDKPPLSLDQIFGLKPARNGSVMENKPDVLIIA